MDIDKVRALSDTELEDALRDARQDLWQARFALSTRQLKDYSTIPATRRRIARILTVRRERAERGESGQGRALAASRGSAREG
jgi:large subunit ribosomal protein L29